MKVRKNNSVAKALFVAMAAIPFLGLPSAVQADLMEIKYDGPGAYGSLEVYANGHDGFYTKAGVLMFGKRFGEGEGDLWDDGSKTFGGFCVELSQPASRKYKPYSIISLEEAFGSTKADGLRELWGRFFQQDWIAPTKYRSNGAEAFGAAVWEIVEDADWDVTAGPGFRCKRADTDLANSWLSALDGTGPKAELRVLSNPTGQDYLVAIPTATPVPEPATIGILGVGSLLFARKRISSAA
jgi:hypothetical protein